MGAGLLAGLGLLAIPGVGPVVAAGWLVATLTGAGVGAAIGGLAGSLTGAGLSEADAHTYAEGVRRGGTLVTVRADELNAPRVMSVLEEHGSVDIDERAKTWQADGWSSGAVQTTARHRGRNKPRSFLSDRPHSKSLKERMGPSNQLGPPLSQMSEIRPFSLPEILSG